MSTIERIDQLSLDEFVRLYEREGAFEYVDGERIPLMPPVALHGWTIRILFLAIHTFAVQNKLGELFTEMPYVLLYGSTWVKGSRVPDLMFFTAERWQQYVSETESWLRKPFLLIPDLAVEVVSPNDLYTEIRSKVQRFRDDGVRLIWVIDPLRSRVDVYHGEQFTTLGKDDALDGGDVLPGLTIPLSTVFTETDAAP